MRILWGAWVPIIAALVLVAGLGGIAKAHDGTNGVISWADIHWNASGTNHLEFDFYYTGHEGCQGNDACVFYGTVQRWVCAPLCQWNSVTGYDHGTVHAWQYDHSVADGYSPVPGTGGCLTVTHSGWWDCHNSPNTVQPCGYAYKHRPVAIDPQQYQISTGPFSNWVAKPC